MATTLNFAPQMAFLNGVFAPGAKAYFYETGTTTPVTVYSDDAYTTPHPSPLEADAGGVFAQVFYGGSLEIKVVVTTAADVSIYTRDPVAKIETAASVAASISFTAVTGNAATNVQTAIANVTAVQQGRSAPIRTFLASADLTEARSNLGLGSAATTNLIDEDDFATDTNAQAPTQQSVKAYVDNLAFGVGQSWQNVAGSRAANTSYQNTTGKPIAVSVMPNALGAGRALQVSTDNSTWVTISTSGTQEVFAQTTTVPPSHYYRFTGAFSLWAELR